MVNSDKEDTKAETSSQKPTKPYEVYFSRNELNEDILIEKYSYKAIKSDSILYGTKNYLLKHYKPSRDCLFSFLLDRVPFFRWIPSYDVRGNLFKDFISGLTIGIIQIPQGLAYSLMAGLPPIVGLYVSFFTVVIYVLLGTSKHLSLGIYAIVSLMTKATIDSFEGDLYPDSSSLIKSNSTSGFDNSTMNPNFLSNDPTTAKVMLGTALAFYSGLIQVFFAIFHVGFVTKYLSDVIVAAFTTGAAYHIVVSQINILLGIKLQTVDSYFKLTEDFIEIFKNIAKTNIATLIISIVSMVFLYTVKHFVNEKFKAKMVVPIPVDLIVVVSGTLFSYFFKFNERFGVQIVGDIPLGFPAPQIPPLRTFSSVFSSSISIAIVSFAINISMAKLFAKKYKYSLDANQELFAYGVGNVISAFFKGFPSCVGLSRSVILDAVGAKTQVYAIFASVLVLIVIVGIGPLFKTLPNACLAAIIVVALISLIIEVRQFYFILKRSKFEALAWLVTFLGVIILDVDYGLYIGLCFSLLLIIAHSQRAGTSVLGNIPYTDIYESIDICEEAQEFEGIKIIRYEASVFYANVENFVYKIVKLSGVNPTEITTKINRKRAEHERSFKRLKAQQKKIDKKNNNNKSVAASIDTIDKDKFDETNHKTDLDNKIQDTILSNILIKDIIIDFSCINFIDSMGINALAQLNESYKEIGVTLHLTYCKGCIFRAFKKFSFKEKFDYKFMYPTTHDAVVSILRKNKANFKLVTKRKSSVYIKLDDITKEPGDHLKSLYIKRKMSNVFDDITAIGAVSASEQARRLSKLEEIKLKEFE